MRISDWSSDVCSSDLFLIVRPVARLEHVEIEPCLAVEGPRRIGATERMEGHQVARIGSLDRAPQHLPRLGILIAERIADRKRVVWGKSVSVRVDLGGRRIITKKN